jgi:hypothetical protein
MPKAKAELRCSLNEKFSFRVLTKSLSTKTITVNSHEQSLKIAEIAEQKTTDPNVSKDVL